MLTVFGRPGVRVMPERREVGGECPLIWVRLLPIVCPAGIDDVLQLFAGVGAEAELTARRKPVEVAIDLHGEVAEVGVGVPELVVLGFLGGEDSAVVHVI